MSTSIIKRKVEQYLELALEVNNEELRSLLIQKVADLADENLRKQNKGQQDRNTLKRISEKEGKRLEELATRYFADDHVEHMQIIQERIADFMAQLSKPALTEEVAEEWINESINSCKKKLKELEEAKRNINEYIQRKENWYLEQNQNDLNSIKKIVNSEIELLEERKELEIGSETLDTAITNMEQVEAQLKEVQWKQGDDNSRSILLSAKLNVAS